jgi:hypothetical protein
MVAVAKEVYKKDVDVHNNLLAPKAIDLSNDLVLDVVQAVINFRQFRHFQEQFFQRN